MMQERLDWIGYSLIIGLAVILIVYAWYDCD